MTVPSTPNLPPAPEFPTYRLREFLPSLLLGWGLGAALTFAARALGQALLRTPCEGHTLLALMMPLVLGPGGLAFTALNWRRPGRAALGLGLVLASLVPALYVGALDIGRLRGSGCAGGYIVVSNGNKAVTGVNIPAGTTLQLSGRIGGFTPQTHPGTFTLRGGSNQPGVQVTLPRTSVRAGEVFPIQLSIQSSTGLNTYTVGLQATTRQDGKTVSANSTLEVNVRPAETP